MPAVAPVSAPLSQVGSPLTSVISTPPERIRDLPGGGKRMVMRSRGVEMTLVNGEVTWEKGALTGASAGRVLRS